MITIYVDTETSGLRPPRAVVLEVGAVATEGDRELGSFSSLVNPGDAVLDSPHSARALQVNQIDPGELRRARRVDEVAADFRGWLMEWGPVSLFAFNTDFDAGFLHQPPWSISRMCWGGCVMKTLAGKERYVKLSKCADRFGLQWEGDAHRALADARMAFRVHRAYLKHNGLVRV
jgi:DNA polymerase III epsilon subunit-like protein